MFDISSLMSGLAETRKVFHSEADFRHALAWHIHQTMPNSQVRLEVDPRPGASRRKFLDIWLPKERIAIELKYATRGLQLDHSGESFALRDHGAQDQRRYDFLKDIHRLENMHSIPGLCKAGHAVLLTNDSSYWTPPRNRGTVDSAFRLHEGRTVSGELAWAAHAGSGTVRSRESPLQIKGSYRFQWQEYSNFPEMSRGRFRFITVSVEDGHSVSASVSRRV